MKGKDFTCRHYEYTLGNVTRIFWLPSTSKHSTIWKFKISLLFFLQPPLKRSKTAHDCWISECAPQLFVTSGLITPHCVQCICKQCCLVICTRFCLIVLSCIMYCSVGGFEITGWAQSYNKPLSTTPLSLWSRAGQYFSKTEHFRDLCVVQCSVF